MLGSAGEGFYVVCCDPPEAGPVRAAPTPTCRNQAARHLLRPGCREAQVRVTGGRWPFPWQPEGQAGEPPPRPQEGDRQASPLNSPGRGGERLAWGHLCGERSSLEQLYVSPGAEEPLQSRWRGRGVPAPSPRALRLSRLSPRPSPSRGAGRQRPEPPASPARRPAAAACGPGGPHALRTEACSQPQPHGGECLPPPPPPAPGRTEVSTAGLSAGHHARSPPGSFSPAPPTPFYKVRGSARLGVCLVSRSWCRGFRGGSRHLRLQRGPQQGRALLVGEGQRRAGGGQPRGEGRGSR